MKPFVVLRYSGILMDPKIISCLPVEPEIKQLFTLFNIFSSNPHWIKVLNPSKIQLLPVSSKDLTGNICFIFCALFEKVPGKI